MSRARGAWCGRAPVLVLLLAVAGACRAPVPAISQVQRLDVDARIEPTGTVQVEEQIAIDVPADGGAFTRYVSGERSTGVRFVSSSVDNQPVEPDAVGEVALRVDDGDGLAATWTFASPASGPRIVTFTYRIDQAIAVQGRRGSLRWDLITPGRGFAVSDARVRVTVADGVHLYEGTGIAEAGWRVAWIERGVAAERSGIAAGEAITVVVNLDVNPGTLAEPPWQRQAEWTRLMVPAFISGAVFILVVGAGILWIIRFQYSPRRAVGPAAERDRAQVRSGLRTAGLASIGVAVVLAVVTWLTLSRFGAWPQLLPLSVFVVGATFVGVSRWIV